jgi:hypothetical protein
MSHYVNISNFELPTDLFAISGSGESYAACKLKSVQQCGWPLLFYMQKSSSPYLFLKSTVSPAKKGVTWNKALSLSCK